MNKPDLNMRTAEPDEVPDNNWCKSGHVAESTWKHPVTGEVMPRRFFVVSGRVLPERHAGVYCEECLAKANARARELKIISS